MMLRDFAEAIRPELQALAVPEPSAELLGRILASRRAGARVILPHMRDQTRRDRRPFVLAAAVAAVLVVLVMRGRASGESFASSGFLSGVAFAQERVAHVAALPPMRVTHATALRRMTIELERHVRDSAGGARRSRVTIGVTAEVVAGIAAWRITLTDGETVEGRAGLKAETLYVARADLRLLRRDVHVSPYRRYGRINIAQRFSGDSITGRMTTDQPSIGAGRPIGTRLPAEFGPYIPDALQPLFLMSTPLQRDWSAGASVLGWAVVPNDVFTPIELRVTGEERIQVPAGTFDCWRVDVAVSGRTIVYWARKSDGLGVRVQNGARELVLTEVR